MAEVTGMTAAAIDERLDNMIVSADIDDLGQMIFERANGETINAGPIVPPAIAVEQSHPVGSIYIGVTPVNPADLLGIGVWARFGKGKMLVSQDDAQVEFDTAQETGGAKEVTLSAAQSGLRAHKHTIPGYGNTSNDPTGGGRLMAGDSAAVPVTYHQDIETADVASAPAAEAHNNLPPYIVVYMWRRTA